MRPEEESPGDMRFPMYTVPVEALQKMTKIEPHEVLQEGGVLVEYEKNLGKAAFVSHQWIGSSHPDPEFKQMRVLQQALEQAMLMRSIPVDITTEAAMGGKPMSTSQLWSAPLFIWYDYFSIPQLDINASGQKSTQRDAIATIPTYVGQCDFFFALVPFVEKPCQTGVVSCCITLHLVSPWLVPNGKDMPSAFQK